jgi:hypothetical protein
MLKHCAAAPVFSDAICSHKVVSVLNRDVGEQPQFIEDARWLALASIYCDRTSEMMRGLFQSAIEIISDARTCRTEASCAAMHILQKMLATDDVIRPFMVDCDLCRIVIALLMLNPDHSVLHSVGRGLIVALFDCPLTRPKAIEYCLMPMIAVRETENLGLRASLYAIVRAVAKLRVGITDLRNTAGFVDLLKAVRQNADLMNSIYGGITPIFDSAS